MSGEAAHNKGWEIFEVVFGVPFLVGLALQAAFPVSLPRGAFTPVFVIGGAALIAAGGTLAVMARRELSRRSQPTGPGLPAHELVTSGVFSISRNPLYLGGVCALAGIALAANLPWVLVLLVPALVACHYILIRPEEAYLAAKFGRAYEDYAASVRRWLGGSRRRS